MMAVLMVLSTAVKTVDRLASLTACLLVDNLDKSSAIL
jgi:hypothetical protein